MIQAANSFNCPLRVVDLPLLPTDLIEPKEGAGINKSLFEINTSQVLVQTVKMVSEELKSK